MTQRELDKAYEKFIHRYQWDIDFAVNQAKQQYQSKADLSSLYNETATFLAAISAFGGTGYFAYLFFTWKKYWLAILAVAMLLFFAWFALNICGSKDRLSDYFFENHNCRWEVVRSFIESTRKIHLHYAEDMLTDPDTLEFYRDDEQMWEDVVSLAESRKKECNEIFDHILCKAEHDTWWKPGSLKFFIDHVER